MQTSNRWRMVNINTFTDGRGCLSVYESNDDLKINRMYYLHGCSEAHDRGMHAHKELEQLLIAVSGSCVVLLDDGFKTGEVLLNDPTKGLRISKMVWREIRKMSEDCVLIVLASHKYDENDYIRDHNEFLNIARGAN